MTTQWNVKKALQGSLIWLITTLFVIYAFCLTNVDAAFIDEIKLSLDLDDVGISIALGSFILGFAIMQIPAGYLLDRYNIRLIVCCAIVLIIIGNFLISYADNLLLFSLANLLQGMGSSFAFIAAGVLFSEWFSIAMFPILMGLIETISTLIGALLHYVFLISSENFSWQEIYKVLGIVGSILFVLAILFVKSPPDYHRKKPISFKLSLQTVTANPQIWLCAIAAATSFGILLAYADLWYVQVQKYYSVEHNQTAIIGSMFYFGIGLGTPLLGWISNLVKSRKFILHVTLVLGNMALMLAIYLPHFAIETLIIIKIISFLTGFLLSGSMLFYTIVKEDTTESTRGVALSITNMAVFLFNSVMLLIPYIFLTSISRQFFTYLWLLPFCVMISILLLYFVREPKATYQSIG